MPTEEATRSFERGNKPYVLPRGWNRYGLKVLGKFENDTWLGEPGPRTSSSQGEWAVSYHGTHQSNVCDIVNEGFDLNKSRRSRYGRGIYSSPYPEEAEMYAEEFQHEGKRYKVMTQNRVNMNNNATKIVNNGRYYLTYPDGEIRLYGILIKQAGQ
jgi:hypothetical protein